LRLQAALFREAGFNFQLQQVDPPRNKLSTAGDVDVFLNIKDALLD
jgi:hypothetical protein